MSELSPPSPRSSIARFGVSIVGPKFSWAWLETDEDGNQVVRERQFRANPGMSFQEQLAYQTSLSKFQAQAIMAMSKVENVVKVVTDAGPDGDPMPRLMELADQTSQGEIERWEILLDQVLMLVAPADREELRPLLEHGNPHDVRELKKYLAELVIERVQDDVAAAARVDPTLQPSSSD